MAKFYVQCGCYQIIVDANDSQQAAIRLIDHVLQSHLWIYDDPDLSDDDRRDHLMLEALMHLDSAVRVSERGFDREAANLVGTPEIISHWHQLILGITRMFAACGLAHRSTTTIATLTSNDHPAPRLPR